MGEFGERLQYIIIYYTCQMNPELEWDGRIELSYVLETFDFTLETRLNCLHFDVRLLDVVNGVEYANTYDSSSLETQIKGGFEDLLDLFLVFTPTKEFQLQLQRDQNKAKTSTPSGRALKKYRLGEKIINGRAQYCIKASGKIEIVCEIDRGCQVKKTKIYSSALSLKKIKQLGEKELANIRFRQIETNFEERLEKLQAEFNNRVEGLKEETERLKMENLALKQAIRKREEKQAAKVQNIFGQSEFKSLFIFGTSTIYYLSFDWTQLTSKMKIPYDRTTTFKVRILKPYTRNIMIGVTDILHTRKIKNPFQTEYAFAYSLKDNDIYHHQKNRNKHRNQYYDEKNRSQVSEIVIKTTVKLWKGQIQWTVNGEQKAKLKDDILKDQDYEMHPYIEMCNQQDLIQWINE